MSVDKNNREKQLSLKDRLKQMAEQGRARSEELQRTNPNRAKWEQAIGCGCVGLVVLLLVGFIGSAVVAGVQQGLQDASTPIPTDTPVPPTPTPNLNTGRGVVNYAKSILGSVSLSGSITNVTFDGDLHITEYINSNSVWDKSAAKTDVEDDSFAIQQAVWTNSRLKKIVSAVYVVIQSDLTDRYGNSSRGDIGHANLMADTAAKFNWNGLTAQDAWNNQDYDSQWMLPDIANS